jgi:PIN domain nuclease of toxin-antitoxin system
LRLLLDTHAVLWWFNGDRALSHAARAAIESDDNQIFVSAVSAMEVSTKHRIGKLPRAGTLANRFAEMVEQEAFIPLPVTLVHGVLGGRLPIDHKDPFDRLLIAQALLESLTLVSNERTFDTSGVVRLW